MSELLSIACMQIREISMEPINSTTPLNNQSCLALFDGMWKNYLELNPDARRIHDLFSQVNEGVVVNDHIALRTFNNEKINIDKIAKPFLQAGYKQAGTYDFNVKKLNAQHFEHEDKRLPKVFISELRVGELSDHAQAIITSLIKQLDADQVENPEFCYSGRPWKITTTNYLTLLKESEYAAWIAAFGYRPNHFTVSINHLAVLSNIERVNQFLQEHGFRMNESGGLVKGSPEVLLEQSSTMANVVDVSFSDGKTLQIPSCFYEFAKRYPMENGELYQGFVTASADKIFESTHHK